MIEITRRGCCLEKSLDLEEKGRKKEFEASSCFGEETELSLLQNNMVDRKKSFVYNIKEIK